MRVVLKPAGTLALLVVIAVLCFFAFNSAGFILGKPLTTPMAAAQGTPQTSLRFRPLDLTRIGKTDWVQFGAAPGSTPGLSASAEIKERMVRKKGVTPLISDLEIVGPTPVDYDGDPRAFKWTDGDTIPTATEVRTGLRTDGVGNGFRFKVKPIPGKHYQMKVWTGGSLVRSKLQARMSDGSPLSKLDESYTGVGGSEFRSLYTISFQVTKPGQELIFSYIVAESREGGSVSLQAAALD